MDQRHKMFSHSVTLWQLILALLGVTLVGMMGFTHMSRDDDRLQIFYGCSEQYVEANEEMRAVYLGYLDRLTKKNGGDFYADTTELTLYAYDCGTELVLHNSLPTGEGVFGGIFYLRVDKKTFGIVSETWG